RTQNLELRTPESLRLITAPFVWSFTGKSIFYVHCIIIQKKAGLKPRTTNAPAVLFLVISSSLHLHFFFMSPLSSHVRTVLG
ncbi:MAG: hypothetical protein ACLFT2_02420, partial [Candidatus Brocadiia bacterium]